MNSRIALLIRRLDHGGAQRQLVLLATMLASKGYDVHVVALYPGGGFEAELALAGVPVHVPGKRGRWDTFSFFARLAECLRNIRPDVLYSFLDVPNILAAIITRIAGRPRLVWGIRAAFMDMRHYDWITRSAPWLEARMSHVPDLIIANSHAGAAWAISRGFPANVLRIVENGIDTRRYRPDANARNAMRAELGVVNNEKLIGLVGRLDPMKDHPVFLRACAKLAITNPGFRFVCVGDGSNTYRSELVSLVQQLGIDNRLKWVGACTDMPAIYNALDGLCSASAFGEGFSNVIGEAMACGVPCVVTDVGDSARIVDNLGEVVPPGDVDAMTYAVDKIILRIKQEPDLSMKLRHRINTEFSLDRMVVRTEQLLSEFA